jgi:hypothetical protein
MEIRFAVAEWRQEEQGVWMEKNGDWKSDYVSDFSKHT